MKPSTFRKIAEDIVCQKRASLEWLELAAAFLDFDKEEAKDTFETLCKNGNDATELSDSQIIIFMLSVLVPKFMFGGKALQSTLTTKK